MADVLVLSFLQGGHRLFFALFRLQEGRIREFQRSADAVRQGARVCRIEDLGRETIISSPLESLRRSE